MDTTKVVTVDQKQMLAFIAKPRQGSVVRYYYSILEDVDLYFPFSGYSTFIQDLHKVSFPNGVTRISVGEYYTAAINISRRKPKKMLSLYYLDLAIVNVDFFRTNNELGDEYSTVKALSCSYDFECSKNVDMPLSELSNLSLYKGWSRPSWMSEEVHSLFTDELIGKARLTTEQLLGSELSKHKDDSSYLSEMYNLILLYTCLSLLSEEVTLSIDNTR